MNVENDVEEMVACGTIEGWSNKLGIAESELLRKLDLSEAIDCGHYNGTFLEKGAYPEVEVRDKFPDSFID